MERRQLAGQPIACDRLACDQPQCAALQSCIFGQCKFRAGGTAKHCARVDQKHAARFGQFDPAADPVEQRHAVPSF